MQAAEDSEPGRMFQTPYAEAKQQYGQRLLFVPVAVVEEGAQKLRLLHDGSHHTPANHKIRARAHIPGPVVGDIAAALRDSEKRQEKNIGPAWDFAVAVARR